MLSEAEVCGVRLDSDVVNAIERHVQDPDAKCALEHDIWIYVAPDEASMRLVKHDGVLRAGFNSMTGFGVVMLNEWKVDALHLGLEPGVWITRSTSDNGSDPQVIVDPAAPNRVDVRNCVSRAALIDCISRAVSGTPAEISDVRWVEGDFHGRDFEFSDPGDSRFVYDPNMDDPWECRAPAKS